MAIDLARKRLQSGVKCGAVPGRRGTGRCLAAPAGGGEGVRGRGRCPLSLPPEIPFPSQAALTRD